MTTSHSLSVPVASFLSNGRYFVSITASGTGQSRRHGHVANRWLADPVEDAHGQFLYFRDLDSSEVWSAALQPIQRRGRRYETSSPPGRFQLLHEYKGIQTRLDIAVPPDEDLEIRRLRLKNVSAKKRHIEVTSYFEAVLTWQGADLGHPAFSKLFLQTKFDRDSSAIIVERRPRAQSETWPWLFHQLCGTDVTEFETDRLRFLGRGRTAARPAALTKPLSGTVGNVLDPCCSLRGVIELNTGEERELAFLTGVIETRDALSRALGNSRDSELIERVFSGSEAAELALWKELDITEAQASQFRGLAAVIHYSGRRLGPAALVPPDGDINALFGKHSIPRDRMQIVACDGWDAAATQEASTARRYWNAKGLFTNLIVLAPNPASQPTGLDDRVFTLDVKQVAGIERDVMLAGASLVVSDRMPAAVCDSSPASPKVLRRPDGESVASNPARSEALQFFNGFGGFSEDGSEYVIRLRREDGELKRPPLPWINVVANEQAGFLVTESGAGCSWARNSQANRLTPWSNEPVSDPHGEAFYLRNEETGAVWSPLPGPVSGPADYEVRHGRGYSQFLTSCCGLDQEVTMFVPRSDPIKIVLLRLTNRSSSALRLSLTSYQRLVLGSLPELPSLVVTRHADDQSLRAVNLAAGDFRGGIVFGAMVIDGARTDNQCFTCDRHTFLGRYGAPGNPAALRPGQQLDGAVGAGLDPCFVHQRSFTIPPGATVECAVLLGEAMSENGAAELVEGYRDMGNIRSALEGVKSFWKSLIDGLQVETPSAIFNLMVNGWLVYQTLACRIWARTAFYQSSGAYGYRDQLQDCGNLIGLDPSFAREQILLHARHQFVEGDVLHWWHPEPIERGLRTKFSDDLLWLPLVTTDYIRTTGDFDLLDVREPFLVAPLLQPGEDEVYLTPRSSGETGNIYDHCCRAIDRSLATGEHGLPLMGTGDWNDGMNRVGREGRGESVWVGFFLYRILGSFIPLCERRGDRDRASRYSDHRRELQTALNTGGWDGEWYRRAYYDNGDPLGSRVNDECRIDALAQSWAIISKAAPPERADQAMSAMSRELISEEEGLIRLLTPPFVNTPNDPGYIKGYVAGVRENGGQYTHAACWVVKAVAEHGENQRALRLLEMLTPISHSQTEDSVARYKVEPFAVAADIYGAAPHIGRGGWTWYTGSSGWMYRVAVESILGVRIENGDTLVLNPCIPDEWPSYRVTIRRPGLSCEILVENPDSSAKRIVSADLDGRPVPFSGTSARIPLGVKSGTRQLRLVLG